MIKRLKRLVAAVLIGAAVVSCTGCSELLAEIEEYITEAANYRYMPNLSGVTLSEAKEFLEQEGFTDYRSDTGFSFVINSENWIVTGQNVDAGEKVSIYDEIVLECEKTEDFSGTRRTIAEVLAEQAQYTYDGVSETAQDLADQAQTLVNDPEVQKTIEEVQDTVETITGAAEQAADGSGEETASEELGYVLNTNSKIFHYSSCYSAFLIEDENREETDKTRDELIAEGYSPCENCNP